MGTKVGIIYATNSTMVRRIIHPDRDSELNDPDYLGKGESMMIVEKSTAQTLLQIEAIVTKYTGKPTPDPRCVVLNEKGVVESVIYADPEIDSIPDRTIISHAKALPGDRL